MKQSLITSVDALGIAYLACETAEIDNIGLLLNEVELVLRPSTDPGYEIQELLTRVHKALFLFVQTHEFNMPVFNLLYAITEDLSYEAGYARESSQRDKYIMIGTVIYPKSCLQDRYPIDTNRF